MQNPFKTSSKNLWNKISIISNHILFFFSSSPSVTLLMQGSISVCYTSGCRPHYICPSTGKWDEEQYHQSLPLTLFLPSIFLLSMCDAARSLLTLRSNTVTKKAGGLNTTIKIISWVSNKSLHIFHFMCGSLCYSLKWNLMIQIYR